MCWFCPEYRGFFSSEGTEIQQERRRSVSSMLFSVSSVRLVTNLENSSAGKSEVHFFSLFLWEENKFCCTGNVHVLYWECACVLYGECACVLYWECARAVLGMCMCAVRGMCMCAVLGMCTCCTGNVHVLYWECARAVLGMCTCCTGNVHVLYWECARAILGTLAIMTKCSNSLNYAFEKIDRLG